MKILFTLFCLLSFQLSGHQNFSELVSKTLPSVVTIGVVEDSWFTQEYGDDAGYYEWLRGPYDLIFPASYSQGSGFFIRSDGYIITNAHVVEDGDQFVVACPGAGDRLYPASLVGLDVRSDLAVLKIEPKEGELFPALTFGDSDHLQLGQEVFSIGTPRNDFLESSVSKGIISGKERSFRNFFEIEGYLQANLSLNHGTSGGPLLNLEGEVVGVNAFRLAKSESLGFFIPSHTVEKIAKQLIEKGEITKGVLGVFVSVDWHQFAEAFLFDRNHGAIVEGVMPVSPADCVGIKKGDIITALDGYPTRSKEILSSRLSILEPGTKVCLTIDRDGKVFDLEVTLISDDENFSSYLY